MLAADDAFPDALAGVPFAVAKGGPLLLTGSGSLDADVGTELVRILPPGATVYLLGGTSALSDNVAEGITALGFKPIRYGGATRFETAVIIANQGLGDPATVLEVTGLKFPDALAAGAAAAEVNGALLLTNGSAQSPTTAAYLAGHPDDTRYTVGGPAALADPTADPIVGSDRYQTSALVAASFFSFPDAIGVATGADFPDSLSGGVHIGRLGGPLLLTSPDSLPQAVAGYLAENKTTDANAYVYGGPLAVSPAVEAAVNAALGRVS